MILVSFFDVFNQKSVISKKKDFISIEHPK